MKVLGSSVYMSASSSRTVRYFKKEELTAVRGAGGQGLGVRELPPGGVQVPVENAARKESLSPPVVKVLAKKTALGQRVRGGPEPLEFELSEEDRQKILLIEKMLEVLTGKKLKIRVLEKLEIDRAAGSGVPWARQAGEGRNFRNSPALRLVYHLTEYSYEHEEMSFEARGTLKTAEGEVSFAVRLKLDREQVFLRRTAAAFGQAADPLVVNYKGGFAGFSAQKIPFDLDGDGKYELIPFPGRGSGFLVYDKNCNGRADDGCELFGPSTGDGFAELSRLDSDGSGWIDEDDPAYGVLRVWTKDLEGKDILFSLSQLGIGAIYTGGAAVLFELKDSDGGSLGQIVKTGFFAGSGGTTGTLQQVDFYV